MGAAPAGLLLVGLISISCSPAGDGSYRSTSGDVVSHEDEDVGLEMPRGSTNDRLSETAPPHEDCIPPEEGDSAIRVTLPFSPIGHQSYYLTEICRVLRPLPPAVSYHLADGLGTNLSSTHVSKDVRENLRDYVVSSEYSHDVTFYDSNDNPLTSVAVGEVERTSALEVDLQRNGWRPRAAFQCKMNRTWRKATISRRDGGYYATIRIDPSLCADLNSADVDPSDSHILLFHESVGGGSFHHFDPPALQ